MLLFDAPENGEVPESKGWLTSALHTANKPLGSWRCGSSLPDSRVRLSLQLGFAVKLINRPNLLTLWFPAPFLLWSADDLLPHKNVWIGIVSLRVSVSNVGSLVIHREKRILHVMRTRLNLHVIDCANTQILYECEIMNRIINSRTDNANT